MHKRIRFARGSEAEKNASTEIIPLGMPVFTTDKNLLYIGNGASMLKDLVAINAKNADTAKKLIKSDNSDYSTATDKIIYFVNGVPTESSDLNKGISGKKFIYIQSGQIKESNTNVGGSTQPVYLSSGTVTAITAAIGNNTKPIYLNNGVLTASNATVGSSSRPVYLNQGTLTQISNTLGNLAYRDTVDTEYITNGSVTTDKIADSSITDIKFKPGAKCPNSDHSTLADKAASIFASFEKIDMNNKSSITWSDKTGLYFISYCYGGSTLINFGLMYFNDSTVDSSASCTTSDGSTTFTLSFARSSNNLTIRSGGSSYSNSSAYLLYAKISDDVFAQ